MRAVTTATASARPAAAGFTFDLLGFLLGLGLAYALHWRTADLIWGLWLSSLTIGYATILLGIFRAVPAPQVPPALQVLGKLFLVGFFTVHFGLFHLVHSIFLNLFFPVGGAVGAAEPTFFPDYGHVFAHYWPWLLAAALGERRALAAAAVPVGAFSPMQPYSNVIRMHLLIFFFVGMAVIGLDHFAVYAVVYALYFFPWRAVLGKRSAVAAG